MEGFLQYLLDRFKERSTWAGLLALLGSLGIALNPEQTEAIIALGLAVIGVISVFIKERNVDEKRIIEVLKDKEENQK